MERRLRTSAILLLAGFAVELVTLFSARPTAFLVFVSVGGLLLAAGIGLYLVTLLRGLVPRKIPQ
ncbi:MAG: hypothetical protein JWO56_598 [Acidobacteria bacterium]|nr:hypothetical protein [Acidobacteriota bacterium]